MVCIVQIHTQHFWIFFHTWRWTCNYPIPTNRTKWCWSFSVLWRNNFISYLCRSRAKRKSCWNWTEFPCGNANKGRKLVSASISFLHLPSYFHVSLTLQFKLWHLHSKQISAFFFIDPHIISCWLTTRFDCFHWLWKCISIADLFWRANSIADLKSHECSQSQIPNSRKISHSAKVGIKIT